ncbi:hypothetical protein T439DRAFT_173967 [Meredithblackwellia eburnea MCA 4105]
MCEALSWSGGPRKERKVLVEFWDERDADELSKLVVKNGESFDSNAKLTSNFDPDFFSSDAESSTMSTNPAAPPTPVQSRLSPASPAIGSSFMPSTTQHSPHSSLSMPCSFDPDAPTVPIPVPPLTPPPSPTGERQKSLTSPEWSVPQQQLGGAGHGMGFGMGSQMGGQGVGGVGWNGWGSHAQQTYAPPHGQNSSFPWWTPVPPLPTSPHLAFPTGFPSQNYQTPSFSSFFSGSSPSFAPPPGIVPMSRPPGIVPPPTFPQPQFGPIVPPSQPASPVHSFGHVNNSGNVNESQTDDRSLERTDDGNARGGQRRDDLSGGARNRRPGDPRFGIYRDDKIPARNVLDLARVAKGLDLRTTLMIKNVPTRMTDAALQAITDETVGRQYDFLYLRIDFASEYNVGYGFINFTSPAALLKFAQTRVGTRWNACQSDKLVIASYANIQGKENLINKFRNSAVMKQPEGFRPKIFYSSGPKAGQIEPFPPPDDPSRLTRSTENVQTVGLFPPNQAVFLCAPAVPLQTLPTC